MAGTANDAVEKTKGAGDKVKDTAQGAAEGATNGRGSDTPGPIKDQIRDAFRQAASDIIQPAMQSGGKMAANYVASQGPKLAKDIIVPKAMEAVGADSPGDLLKQGVGKAGEMLSDQGGVAGIAGKLMSKFGGGKGGKKAAATGYGQGRRIMVQQDQYIPVNVKDAFRAWTESEWPEYMHRVNTLDRQIDEDSARYAIGIKGFWFKKNFTAQIQEQVPFKHIVWSTTQGNTKNTGRVSFFEQGEDLTLMILNLDMAPSGLKEKWVRGFRYHKRGIRSDFHRFSAWLQMRTPDQLLDMEGWLGTIEGGKITQTHEEYVEEHEEEQDRAEKADEQAEDVMEDTYIPDDEDEDKEGDEEDDEQDDSQADEEEEDEESVDEEPEEPVDEEPEDEEPEELEDEEPMDEEPEEPVDEEPVDEEPEDEEPEDEEPEEEPKPRAKKRPARKRPARRSRVSR